jgi:hypothetical protein
MGRNRKSLRRGIFGAFRRIAARPVAGRKAIVYGSRE